MELHFDNLKFTCPYCGFVNMFHGHEAKKGIEKTFVYCDVESGGCDREMILVTKVKLSIETETAKVPVTEIEKTF